MTEPLQITQLVTIEVRHPAGLSAGQAREIVEYLVSAGEEEARSAVANDDPEDTVVACQVLACDFSVEVP